MPHATINTKSSNAARVNASGASSVVLVCEHASCDMPPSFDGLGLSVKDRQSHAAWDPGALAVATQISARLDATLIAAQVSRLIYDCNRPPDAPGAMPERSEVIDVPGNRNLSQAARDARVDAFYRPFQAAVAQAIASVNTPIVVTVHSFTPIYHGTKRSVEIGILHDSDTRLADAMLACATTHTSANVERNEPYGPGDGVTHTLIEHGVSHGHLNVMIEIRNDLLETPELQLTMGNLIAEWVEDACAQINVPGDVKCRA